MPKSKPKKYKPYKPRAGKLPEHLPCGCVWHRGRATKLPDGTFVCGCGRHWGAHSEFVELGMASQTLTVASGGTQSTQGAPHMGDSPQNA